MIDPKIASLVSCDFPKNTVVVFDEAHNIGNAVLLSIVIFIRRCLYRIYELCHFSAFFGSL